MSNAAAPVQNTAATSTTSTATSQNAEAMGEAMLTSGTVSSMADLKEQAPDVYKAMMQGIAMNICRDMEHHQARLHKLHEEYRRQAQGA